MKKRERLNGYGKKRLVLLGLCAGILVSGKTTVTAQAAKAVSLKGQVAAVIPSEKREVSEAESLGVYVVNQEGGAHTTDVTAVMETIKAEEAAASVAKAEQPSAGQRVADYAVQFIGNPYEYGGTSLTNGADCSGFVQSVYRKFGVSLPRSSSEQARVGTNIGTNLGNAIPGDLICYSGHIGIYIGGGKIVNASSERTGIKISNASYRPIKSIRRVI